MDALSTPPRYQRPTLRRKGPDRSAGHMYRQVGHLDSLTGVSQATLEAKSMAVLRASTRVANEHFERLRRLGERMHRAGEESLGPDPEAKALDHAEQLVGNAAMALVAWLEGAAAEPGSPWHRIVSAQYTLVGKALGLNVAGANKSPKQSREDRPAERPMDRPPRSPRLEIVHAGAVSRQVFVRGGELPAAGAEAMPDLEFWPDDLEGADPIRASLRTDDGQAFLLVVLDGRCRRGTYTAAVCTKARRQVGWLRIEV